MKAKDKASTPSPSDFAENIRAPDLKSIIVKMDEPLPLDAALLKKRFERALLENLPRDTLPLGSALMQGDIVHINTCALVDQKLIPFSAKLEEEIRLVPLRQLPGFTEAIVQEGSVGATFQVALTLPKQYRIKELRDKQALFIIQVVKGQRPLGLNDENAFKVLELGDDLQTCMNRLRSMLDKEMGDELLVQGQNKVLRAFSAKVDMNIPEAWMIKEIHVLWEDLEGPAIRHFESDIAEHERALASWLKDDETREEVAHRIRLEVGLNALARDHKIMVPERAKHSLLFDSSKTLGVRSKTISESMTPALEAYVDRIARHRFLVEYLMTKVQIKFS